MSKETLNVNEEKSEHQVKLEQKAKDLVDLMNEEPKARLIPKLRVDENGIRPDVSLVLLDNTINDESTEGESEESDGGSEESDTKAELTESQDS